MLRLTLLLLTFSFVCGHELVGDESAKVNRCLQIIQKHPEAEQLMQEIQKDGPIRFAVHDHPVVRQFGASWDTLQRTILISPYPERPEGEIIASILFEMHNASVSKQLVALEEKVQRGELSRQDYIRNVEYLEYLNSKRCAELAQKGIDRGLFPATARLPTYRDFDEHFYYQQISGHSEAVGRIYDQIRNPLNYW